jgi:hypothetical protein
MNMQIPPPVPPDGGIIWGDPGNPTGYDSSEECTEASSSLDVQDGYQMQCFPWDDGKWYLGIWPEQEQPDQSQDGM